MPCPNCHQEHDSTGCPPTPVPDLTAGGEKKYFGMTGWKCPNCGAGVSPFTNVCPVCRPYTLGPVFVTYNTPCTCYGYTGPCKLHGGFGAGSVG